MGEATSSFSDCEERDERKTDKNFPDVIDTNLTNFMPDCGLKSAMTEICNFSRSPPFKGPHSKSIVSKITPAPCHICEF
jgi:hypothetical protein